MWRFDLKKRKPERFLEKIDGGEHQIFLLTSDGKRALYSRDRKLVFARADRSRENDSRENEKSESDKPVDTANLEVWVDPRAEWGQIYHEVWRIDRDFLYDPRAHGLDLSNT